MLSISIWSCTRFTAYKNRCKCITFFPSFQVLYIYNLKNNYIENKTVAEKHNRFPTLLHPFTSPVIKKNLVKFRISRRPFALRSVTSLLVLHHRLRLLLAQHQTRNKMDLSLKKKAAVENYHCFWAVDGTRTHDTRNHNPLLYQLNYSRHLVSQKDAAKIHFFSLPQPYPLIFLSTKYQTVKSEA